MAVGILEVVIPEMIAAEKQPSQAGCERHDNVIEAEAKVRQQNDRPPPETVGKNSRVRANKKTASGRRRGRTSRSSWRRRSSGRLENRESASAKRG